MPNTKALSLSSAFVAALAIIVAANSVGLYKLNLPNGRLVMWIVTTVFMIVLFGIIGSMINGRIAGTFMDNRNKMSLSKFQIVLWTVTVFPALLTAALANVFGIGGQNDNPLDITIPTELLFALGISGASFVGAPLILSQKTGTEPDPKDLSDTAEALGLKPTDIQNSGKVFGKASPMQAAWGDMFRGDEVGNADTTDLSKVQQFLITLLLIGIYMASIAKMFLEDKIITTLPPIPQQFIWLLAVSHGTYLSYKAAPHTQDKPQPQQGAPAPLLHQPQPQQP
jgi:FtsH-binding integral membrane protein